MMSDLVMVSALVMVSTLTMKDIVSDNYCYQRTGGVDTVVAVSDSGVFHLCGTIAEHLSRWHQPLCENTPRQHFFKAMYAMLCKYSK
jgi:hypothetical protein